MLRFIQLLLGLAAFGLCSISMGSLFGDLHWIMDSLSHFRVQLALAALIGLVAAVLARGWPAAVLAAVALLIHLPFLLPYAGSPLHNEVVADAPRLRILLANVYTGNQDHDLLLRLIGEENPDLIGLLEVDSRWIEVLEPLRERYPHGLSLPQRDNFGMAVFSRIPIQDLEVRRLDHELVPMILGSVEFGGIDARFALVHPVPPVFRSGWILRNRQLETLGRLRSEFSGEEFLLLGDLNVSPWSPHFRTLVDSTGLRDASIGFGIRPTWPTTLPPLMIPIDHVLASSRIAVSRFETGPSIGSDHLPVLVDVALADDG